MKNEALESQPQDVIKLHEEIDSLKTAITKFSKSIDVLDQIVMICREPIEKSRNGYEGDVYNHDKETIVCYFCGKVGHMISKCWDVPKKGKSNAFRTNKKGPKNIWVPKDELFLLQISLTTGRTRPSWYLDNGFSRHMT